MRAVIPALLMLVAAGPALACRCDGCGCKGGPGYRGPNGRCVSAKQLTRVCGSPPTTRCKNEHTAQVCPHEGRSPGERRTKRPDPPTRGRPVPNPFG